MRQFNTKHTINLSLVALFSVFVCTAALIEHHLLEAKKHKQDFGDLPEIKKKGVLTALTLYGSTSYFVYRDKEMGYEYELCADLAESLGLELKIVTVSNMHALEDSLEAGVGDIVAYNVPLNAQIKKKFQYCGRDFLTYQVLVQLKNKTDLVTDVTQLVGRQVVVPENSCFETRLNYLNDELGGGILIKSIKEDSLTTEELIEKVATSHIRYTIADNALARLSKTYYKNLYI
ncbi:MAG: transporter substrate-binding domain-containing protein, partial [Bacteroidota bacterium]|nr:transporter substrate-binding domain-containing protein [Bacteroidota bacterium]